MVDGIFMQWERGRGGDRLMGATCECFGYFCVPHFSNYISLDAEI